MDITVIFGWDIILGQRVHHTALSDAGCHMQSSEWCHYRHDMSYGSAKAALRGDREEITQYFYGGIML